MKPTPSPASLSRKRSELSVGGGWVVVGGASVGCGVVFVVGGRGGGGFVVGLGGGGWLGGGGLVCVVFFGCCWGGCWCGVGVGGVVWVGGGSVGCVVFVFLWGCGFGGGGGGGLGKEDSENPRPKKVADQIIQGQNRSDRQRCAAGTDERITPSQRTPGDQRNKKPNQRLIRAGRKKRHRNGEISGCLKEHDRSEKNRRR